MLTLSWPKPNERKAEQNQLLWFVFGGAALFVFLGTTIQIGNDFLFLGLIAVGALLGFFVGNLVRTSTPDQ